MTIVGARACDVEREVGDAPAGEFNVAPLPNQCLNTCLLLQRPSKEFLHQRPDLTFAGLERKLRGDEHMIGLPECYRSRPTRGIGFFYDR